MSRRSSSLKHTKKEGLFPSLESAKIISFDTETYDPDLKSKGPGVRRGSYIVGISFSTDTGISDYYPIRHEGEGNMDPEKVFSWLRTELTRENQLKLGSNVLYDMDFIQAEGVPIKGRWVDIQVAEPLLDENAMSYSLATLTKKYIPGEEKKTDVLATYCKERGWKGAPQAHIKKIPIPLVAEYAIGDTDLPLLIFKQQIKALKEQSLMDLFWMETDLTKLLLRMRVIGVRIDTDRLEAIIAEVERDLLEVKAQLRHEVGFDTEVWTADSVKKAFDAMGLDHPVTKSGRPSFTKLYLDTHPHKVPKLISDIRTREKFLGTFLYGSIKNMLIEDRIHCQFNQLRGDEYGTVTGRLSSSKPNLQFIPARDEYMGPRVRVVFIPEKGMQWGRTDWSQIEFRLFAHYATGDGAEDLRRTYHENPEVDFHQWCADVSGKPRNKAKGINFGKIYGMGVEKLMNSLGMTFKEATEFMREYDEKIPFVKHMLHLASSRAQSRGYVKTLLGRRRRFNLWEPNDWFLSKRVVPDTKEKMLAIVEEAQKNYPDQGIRPGVRRAKTYKALNAVIQGSAADLMKKSMVESDRAGLFEVLIPHLTVHDEMDLSVPKTKIGEEAFHEMVRIMETVIPLKVPVMVSWKLGSNWGECR